MGSLFGGSSNAETREASREGFGYFVSNNLTHAPDQKSGNQAEGDIKTKTVSDLGNHITDVLSTLKVPPEELE